MEDHNKKELTLTRIFDAPRELVFKAWTDPKLLAKWWGPNGFTNPVCEADARPDGSIHIVMVAGEELGDLNGISFPMTGTFKEIDSPNRIVFTTQPLRDGKPILDNLNTVTFEEYGDKTRMTLHVVVMKATPEAAGPLSGMEIGWSQSLDKLAALPLFTNK